MERRLLTGGDPAAVVDWRRADDLKEGLMVDFDAVIRGDIPLDRTGSERLGVRIAGPTTASGDIKRSRRLVDPAYPGAPHGFDSLPGTANKAAFERAYEDALRRALHPSGPEG